MEIARVSTAVAVATPAVGWEGSVLDAARFGDPATQGAALRRIDQVTGDRAASEALVADPDRQYLKYTNEEAWHMMASATNHRVLVGNDLDGDPLYRELDDADIYGSNANHAGYDNMGPLRNVSWAEENNLFIAQMQQYNAQELALDRFAQAQSDAKISSSAASQPLEPSSIGSSPEPTTSTGAASDEIVVTATRNAVSSPPAFDRPHSLADENPLRGTIVMIEPVALPVLIADVARPILPTVPTENPFHLGTIDLYESQYDAYWAQNNQNGVQFDPVEHARIKQGFADWRIETAKANEVATTAQFDVIRTVLPPLDLALSAGAVAGGTASIGDYVTVAAAMLPGVGKLAGSALALNEVKGVNNAYTHGFAYGDRVRLRGLEDPLSHNFPYSFDDIVLSTNPTSKANGYNLYQTGGSMGGKQGTFEIGVTKDGVIDHRFFRPER